MFAWVNDDEYESVNAGAKKRNTELQSRPQLIKKTNDGHRKEKYPTS